MILLFNEFLFLVMEHECLFVCVEFASELLNLMILVRFSLFSLEDFSLCMQRIIYSQRLKASPQKISEVSSIVFFLLKRSWKFQLTWTSWTPKSCISTHSYCVLFKFLSHSCCQKTGESSISLGNSVPVALLRNHSLEQFVLISKTVFVVDYSSSVFFFL